MLTIQEGTKAFDYFMSKTGNTTPSSYDEDLLPTPTGSGVGRSVHRVENELVIEHVKYASEDRPDRLNVCFDENEWMDRKSDIHCNV